jgi:ABC-type lipoprotein release transport system permease subunit
VRSDLSLARAALWHYRAVNALVVAGVAVAVAVLAGALLVGTSVRASLRELALQRLGTTDVAISTATTFDTQLGAAMESAAPGALGATVGLIAATGTVSHADSGRLAAGVQVYGVDERFWSFHGVQPVPLSGREVALSPGLAAELAARDRDAIVLRVSGPSEIPLGTLQGRRDEGGARLRVTVARTLAADRMGEFSLAPGQGPVLAVFAPLGLLQRELQMTGRVNTTLVRLAPRDGPVTGHEAGAIVTRAFLAGATLADHGLRIRRVPGDRVMALEGLGGYISQDVVNRVMTLLGRVGRPGVPALTYVANDIRVGGRTVPYSTVTAIDVDAYNRLSVPTGPPAPGTDPLGGGDRVVRGALDVRVGTRGARVTRLQMTEATRTPGAKAEPAGADRPPLTDASIPIEGPIWLNEWAATDLDARIGDTVTLEYFLWTDEGGLDTRSASFTLQGIAPMMRAGGDRTLTPDYPGITDAADMTAWDPPFPVDLARVRPADEAYWDRWGASPKAFVPLEIGQRLWGSRFGQVSSIRFSLVDRDAVTAAVREEMGDQIVARPVRAEALAAAEGTTDFGEYFLYFSFFLVVSALLIAYLFFALGVEQRAREVGVLAAIGFTPADIRRGFFREGLVLALVGGVVGMAGAVLYAALIMHGLGTWWVGAVGTTALRLHVDAATLAVGAAGAAVAGAGALWASARALSRRSPRALIHGGAVGDTATATASRRPLVLGLALVLAAPALVAASMSGLMSPTAGFFGAGGAVLVGGLLLIRASLSSRAGASARRAVTVRGILQLGGTHASWRPGRTVLTVSLIGFATFALVSVVAFRRDGTGASLDRTSGTGGFALMAESAVPLMHDPNTADGRASLGLDAREPLLDGASIARVRLRPGDDASCLTLYQPRNPRIIGVDPKTLEGRFTFAGADQASPWTRLDTPLADGEVPAIADQTTLTYVFHLGVGDVFEFAPDGVTPVRFRIVAALSDSLLQSELIISDAHFVRLFPRHEGYRVWLVEAPAERASEVAALLEDRLADFGVDVVDTRARLDGYHRVENTYLATFQALGALGLLLGTLGVGAVLARNVVERQREWGLLRAVGYEPRVLGVMVLAESAVLVAGGVLLGAIAAAIAVAPAIVERAQALPLGALAGVLGAVVVTGLLSSMLALGLAVRVPVVTAIKNE